MRLCRRCKKSFFWQGERGGGLLVCLDEQRAGAASSAEAVAARWFAQDLFEDPNVTAEEELAEALPARRAAAAADDSDGEASPSGKVLAMCHAAAMAPLIVLGTCRRAVNSGQNFSFILPDWSNLLVVCFLFMLSSCFFPKKIEGWSQVDQGSQARSVCAQTCTAL
jgi:hypothetical protein